MAPPVARAPWTGRHVADFPRNRAQIAVAFHQMRGKNNALVQPLGRALCRILAQERGVAASGDPA